MASPSPAVSAALTSLRERWGAAAPRPATEVAGALALAPRQAPSEGTPADLAVLQPVVVATGPAPAADAAGRPGTAAPGLPWRPDPRRVVPTGFPALDAILGPGGLPREAGAVFRGDASSGKTTLALRLVAEVQAAGGIVAYLDLADSLDPVEAVARGVRLEWLVVLVPRTLAEALAMAATLLQDRAVDLLLLDLPARSERVGAGEVGGASGPSGKRPATIADRLQRLAALARRAGAGLLVLEPPGLPAPLRGALAESAGLRLELVRRAWIRLGRDVVGQRTEVTVTRNRFGPSGRRAELLILYAEAGRRDACLERPGLLREEGTRSADRPDLRRPGAGPPVRQLADPVALGDPVGPSTARRSGDPAPLPVIRPGIDPVPLASISDATPPPVLASPPPPPQPQPGLRLVPGRPGHPRRPALDGRRGPGRRSGGPRPRRPAGNAAR